MGFENSNYMYIVHEKTLYDWIQQELSLQTINNTSKNIYSDYPLETGNIIIIFLQVWNFPVFIYNELMPFMPCMLTASHTVTYWNISLISDKQST